MYSKRLSWSLQPNAISRHISEKRGEAGKLLDLTNSNPTILSDYPHPAIASVFASLRDFTYLPNAAGEPGAREAVCGYYREHGVNTSPDRILLTASTSEGYALLFKLLCDPGDEILVPTPSYPLFDYLASLESVRSVSYPIHYDGSWYVDVKELAGFITGRTRAIVVVTPNNPTGSCLKNSDASQLLSLSRERSIPIIADEVFLDYPLGSGAGPGSLAAVDEALTFCLSGLSKSAAMPQMKLGWLIVNGDNEARRQAVERLELLSDTFLSVNTPVQKALAGLLETGSSIRRGIRTLITDNYRAAQRTLRESPAHALHAEAGWSAIIQLPATRPEEDWVKKLLDEENCIVQPGYFFDLPMQSSIVLSLLTERPEFLHGLERIRDLVQRYA